MIAYRVRADDRLGMSVSSLQAFTVGANARVQYDDGTEDEFKFAETAVAAGTPALIVADHRVKMGGELYAATVYVAGGTIAPARGSAYAQLYINRGEDVANPNVMQVFSQGYISAYHNPYLGSFEPWTDYCMATMNVTYTQANVAGGAVVCEISPGLNGELVVVNASAHNSGTNGINIGVEGSTGGTPINTWSVIGSGAGTTGAVPETASFATTTGYTIDSSVDFSRRVRGTQALYFKQTAAGAQNDTFQILVNIMVRATALPTVIHSNSTNPANVSVTAGAESFTVI